MIVLKSAREIEKDEEGGRNSRIRSPAASHYH